MLAAPLPPAPRQPMRSMDRGVRQRRKPARPLFTGECQLVSGQAGERARPSKPLQESMQVSTAAEDAHGRGVAKGAAQVAVDPVLGGEVELLEELGAHGDAGGGAEAVQGLGVALVVVVVAGAASALLDAAVVGGHGGSRA